MKRSEEIRHRILELVEEYDQARKAEETFTPGEDPILYNTDVIDDKELKAVFNTVLDLWWGVDEEEDAFEQELSEFIGTSNAVFTNSGSSANLLAVSALRAQSTPEKLADGSKIITPATTFPTTINPIIQNGFTPVVIDSDADTYNADIASLKAAASDADAIMLPHMFGIPNRMDAVMDIAADADLLVIEDVCDSFGSCYDGRRLGSFGDLATTSFYAAHHLSTGEGGAVFTADDALAKTVRSLRDWGRQPLDAETETDTGLPEDYPSRFLYRNIGYNLKPLELQAAMGRVQLTKVQEFKRARKEHYQFLRDVFEPYTDHVSLPEPPEQADVSWFCFPFVIEEDAEFSRADMVQHLDAAKIHNRPLLAGNITRHPAYRDAAYQTAGTLENADHVMRNGLFIGVHPRLSEEQLAYMASTVRQFFAQHAS